MSTTLENSDSNMDTNNHPERGAAEGANGNGQKEVTKDIVHLSLLLVGIIVFVDASTDLFVIVDLNQYAYGEFREIRFPNTTINATERGKSHCDRDTNSTSYKMEQTVQEEVSRWSAYTSLASNIPAIIAAPLLCSLSDIYGRKYCFLISLFGNSLKNLLIYAGMMFNLNIRLFGLFLFVRGCTGGRIAIIALASSYVADVFTGKNRPFAITSIGVFISIGTITASFASGYFIESFGYATPVLVAAFINIIIMITVWIFLRESLTSKNRTASLNVFIQIRAALNFYFSKEKPGSSTTRWKFVIYLSAIILNVLGNFGKINIEIFYQLGQPFCWNSVEIGIFGTVRSAMQGIVSVPLIRLLQCCIPDEVIAILGSMSACAYFAMEGLAANSFQLYIGK